IEIALDQCANGRRREPLAKRLRRGSKCLSEATRRGGLESLVEQDQMQIELEEFPALAVQVVGSPLDRFARDWVVAGRGRNRFDLPLRQVLVDAAVFVEQTKRRFESVHDVTTLLQVEALEIHAGQAVDESHVPGLRQEGAVVDEAPERQQAVN